VKNGHLPRYVDVYYQPPGCIIFLAAMAVAVGCWMLLHKQSNKCEEKGGILVQQSNVRHVCIKGTVIE
jgi:hypothetical protein